MTADMGSESEKRLTRRVIQEEGVRQNQRCTQEFVGGAVDKPNQVGNLIV